MTERRCFSMIQYKAYMLVDLLPPFLKTYGFGLGDLNGRRLSGEKSLPRLEIGKLESLTRDLNALQVRGVVPVIDWFDSILTAAAFHQRHKVITSIYPHFRSIKFFVLLCFFCFFTPGKRCFEP